MKDNLYTAESNLTYINPKDSELYEPPPKKVDLPKSDSSREIIKPVNIQESADTIRANIKDSMKKNEDNLKDIIIKIHLIKTVIYAKEDSLNNKKKELDTVLSNQQVATENNDFDEAQELENHATCIKDFIRDLKKVLQENEKEMVTLREQELACIKQRIKVFEEAQATLKKLKNRQDEDLENFVNNNIYRHKNDKIKIKKMNEKLEILKQNLETKKSVFLHVNFLAYR